MQLGAPASGAHEEFNDSLLFGNVMDVLYNFGNMMK